MVIMTMNKVNRLSERPKPPSWEETQKDVSGAEPNDVVFEIGKDYLPQISGCLSHSVEGGINTSGASSTSMESDRDLSVVDPSRVEASYADVTRLISLNKELKNIPASLVEQHAKLRLMGEDMTKSVKELKEMALSMPALSSNEIQQNNSSTTSQKTKSKQKKKK